MRKESKKTPKSRKTWGHFVNVSYTFRVHTELWGPQSVSPKIKIDSSFYLNGLIPGGGGECHWSTCLGCWYVAKKYGKCKLNIRSINEWRIVQRKTYKQKRNSYKVSASLRAYHTDMIVSSCGGGGSTDNDMGILGKSLDRVQVPRFPEGFTPARVHGAEPFQC